MCGITGFIHLGISQGDAISRVKLMMQAIWHRGPDDGGVWIDERHGVAFGHRRLSIIDTTQAGHQPMESVCGRYVIVFNGEIYNHAGLREELEKSNNQGLSKWRGHSDTETLIMCISAWGVHKALTATVGMFAFALWDKFENKLILARDRIGEKPLYYGWQNNTFLFGSEIKSLKQNPSFTGELDWSAASEFLRHNYIPAPFTIYQNIRKLVPGTYLTLDLQNFEQKSIGQPVTYWSISQAVQDGDENQFRGSFDDAADELESLIKRSVKLQSVADVPTGAFLSGGIDSSTVAAFMKLGCSSKITTFSIGMPDEKMDESRHAALVAKYLGTNHVQHIIQPSEALDLIPKLSQIWDEPFADSSQIPTYLVSQLAKKEVTVALSGDGGDEFFLGYPQYSFYRKLWKSRFLGRLPWDSFFSIVSRGSSNTRLQVALRQGRSIVNAWRQSDSQALNRYWVDRYRKGPVPLQHQMGLKLLESPIVNDPAMSASIWDASTYLPDDILVKVDRAAMANSLETRAPLLDHRIIEFAYRLPVSYKLDNGIAKRVLKEVLYRQVPQALVDRPKMGFSIPMTSWLRNELRPWAEELLATIPNDSPFFNKKQINLMWGDHISGKRIYTEQLWGVLSLLGFLK